MSNGSITKVCKHNKNGFLGLSSNGSETTYYCDYQVLSISYKEELTGLAIKPVSTMRESGIFSFQHLQYNPSIGTRLVYLGE